MSDQLPTAGRVSDPGIRALFRQENRFQAWLDVEAALAEAQAELGIIPETAAPAIRAASRYDLLDRARLDEGLPAPVIQSCPWCGNSPALWANHMAAGCIGARRRRTSSRLAISW